MPTPVLFAAGVFENPWIVAVLLLVGALVNWLTKRRAEKEAARHEDSEPPAADGQPEAKLDLEEALRRLMGEQPPARPPPPPPPLTDPARGGVPAPARPGETPYPIPGPIAPTSRPPPVPRPAAGFPAAAAGEKLEQVVRRFEQLEVSVRQAATPAAHGGRPRSGAAGRTAARWRDRRSARQAFVAAMIFAPPKSLEP